MNRNDILTLQRDEADWEPAGSLNEAVQGRLLCTGLACRFFALKLIEHPEL